MRRDTKPDGGPVYPSQYKVGPGGSVDAENLGISLRDWFAGQALASMSVTLEVSTVVVAMRAYAVADAMLAERAK